MHFRKCSKLITTVREDVTTEGWREEDDTLGGSPQRASNILRVLALCIHFSSGPTDIVLL